MEKYRRQRIITIIILMMVITGVSIGFAAFTNILTISSSATVTPEQSAFSVLFSSSGTSQLENQITPTVTGATGDKATISGTTISGLTANFTEPGQTVTYNFWVHNAGSYIAYLTRILYENISGDSTFKVCIPETGTAESLVTLACDDIDVYISVGGSNFTNTTSVSNHPLEKNLYEQVNITITYAADGDRADGTFNVSFGNITMEYRSADLVIINFTMDGVLYQAVDGMTFGQWVNSEYNTGGFKIGGTSEICTSSGRMISSASESDLIVSNNVYGKTSAFCIVVN